jgi:hypothetical protein
MTITTPITCICGSHEATVLGALGNRLWFRCRDCGLDREATPRDLASLSEAVDQIDTSDEPVEAYDLDEYVSRDIDLDLNGVED